MPIRSQLRNAISTLLTFQNEDGGIPAVLPGQNSGAWTTASCLECFLLCAYSPPDILDSCIEMVKFLLNAQLPSGGWPYVNTPPISTLSTGHTLSSLILARKYFRDQNLVTKMNIAIDKAFKWLKDHQNSEGGWGVQPSPGDDDGNATRISSTYYALRPYWMMGVYYKDLEIIRNAIDLLIKFQRTDGGWPFVQGQQVDTVSEVSNTSRAVLAILRSQYVDSDSEIIKRAISFIVTNKLQGSSWKLGVEGFSSSLPTVTLYHNNSPCDALEALVCAKYFGDATKEAFAWLLSSQRDDGIWELMSPDVTQHGLERAWTWSTSEFVHVLNLASENYLKHEVDALINRAVD